VEKLRKENRREKAGGSDYGQRGVGAGGKVPHGNEKIKKKRVKKIRTLTRHQTLTIDKNLPESEKPEHGFRSRRGEGIMCRSGLSGSLTGPEKPVTPLVP